MVRRAAVKGSGPEATVGSLGSLRAFGAGCGQSYMSRFGVANAQGPVGKDWRRVGWRQGRQLPSPGTEMGTQTKALPRERRGRAGPRGHRTQEAPGQDLVAIQ